MELINLIYEPIVIILFISLVITVIMYFIARNKAGDQVENSDGTQEENKTNISQILFYTFISSFIILVILKYLLEYMNNNNYFQKGGFNASDNITIVDDDVDFGLIDDP
jgi:heme/copper-type cytochrome/quinol oxidase subunit 2